MKRLKNCSIHDTPLELWAVILSYLPVKSVLRFRSVSKSWKSIIKHQNFSAVHLKHCSNNTSNPYLIISQARKWVLHCQRTAHPQDEEIPFLREGYMRRWHVCGGVDGLFLLRNNSPRRLDSNLLLWNPSTGKCIHLPINRSTVVNPTLLKTQCLMFDASSDDYKVVMVHYHGINSIPTLVDVFSLKSQSWRKVVDSGGAAPGSRMSFFDDNASVGPCAHWIGQQLPKESLLLKIISFDLTSNKFSYTPLPKDANYDDVLVKKIFVLDGCALGLLSLSSCLITIWAMEISSTSHSWTQKYQIRVEPLVQPFVFCVQKRDILITEGTPSLVLYDLETGSRKLVQQVYNHISNVNYNHISNVNYIYPYVESLLLSDIDAPFQHHLRSLQD